MSKLMTAKEAAEYLWVSLYTLQRMDGDIRPAKLAGGKRSYKVKWLNEYLEGSKGNRRKGG